MVPSSHYIKMTIIARCPNTATAYKSQKDGKKLIEIYWFRSYVCRGHVSSGARCTGWDKSLLSEYIQLKRHQQHVVEVNSVSYWRKTVVKNRVLVKSFFLNPTISVSSNNFLLVKICCVVPAGDFILHKCHFCLLVQKNM